MIFKNTLILGKEDSESPISPTRVTLQCMVERLHRADLNVMSASLNTKVAYANFSFNLEMFNDGTYSTPFQAEDYPVDVKVGDRVYLAGSVDNVNGLDVLAKECYATPSADPSDARSYPLIQSG